MSQSALDAQLTFGQVYDEDDEEMEIPEELRQQLFASEGSASQLPRVRRPPRVVALTEDLTQSTLEDAPGEMDLVDGGEEGEGQQSTGMAKDWLLEQLRQAQMDQNRQQEPGEEDERRVEAQLRKWLKTERVNLWTHVPETPIDLDFGTEGLATELPQTIPHLLKAAAKQCPSTTALSWRDPSSGEPVQLTYEQYWWKVVNIARSFIRHGIFRFARVCIVGSSCAQWHCTTLGAILAGGVIMGISPESSEEEILEVFTTCKVSICVVENLHQFGKVYQVWPQLPHLNAVVLWDGHFQYPLNRVYEWENFLAKGLAVGLDAVTEEMQKQEVVHCTVLSCTAGSSRHPKRAMLTHDNIVWTAKSLKAAFDDTLQQEGKERFVSFFPPLHITNLVVEVFLPILLCGCVYVAPPPAPEEGLAVILREAQPTVLFGQPRVWQQLMQEAMVMGGAGGGAGGGKSKQKSKKGHKTIGLDRCRLPLVGGAPVPGELLDFFAASKVQLREVYGSAETTGFAFANKLEGEQSLQGSQGLCLPGVKMSIGTPDTTGNGEVLVRGRNVFSGFYGDEEGTEEAIDEEGWLHTGDIGRRDERGFLHLLARKGEVLITTPGEYVLPEPIEATLLEYIPFIGHAFVIGHTRQYLTCLFTIKGEVDPETGEPTGNIHEGVVDLVATAGGRRYTTASELLDAEDEGVSQAIVDGITKYNQEHAPSYNQKILKFHLLEMDFTIHGGELDADNKPKRAAILEKYAEEIEQLYAE